jgi:hypothetical protein
LLLQIEDLVKLILAGALERQVLPSCSTLLLVLSFLLLYLQIRFLLLLAELPLPLAIAPALFVQGLRVLIPHLVQPPLSF